MNRFVTSTLGFADIMYARCPHCLRMDLNSWTGKTYEPPFWMRWKLNFGAKRYRCEYCRKNFVSFRKKKESFTFARWAKRNAGQIRADGRARVNGLKSQHRSVRLVADVHSDAMPLGDGESKQSREEESHDET